MRSYVKGVTVDGVTSKDLDDAFWLDIVEEKIILTVSISDVSSAITPGSKLDLKARKAAFTRYGAFRNIPMIPPELSEDTLSLLPNVDRQVLTFKITLDQNSLDVSDLEISRNTLKSEMRLSHDRVNNLISNKTAKDHQIGVGA
ncbi:RNB domain-containing ribonuclease [Kiloniella sp.]|uniref:RNB domain-containing ribonuclease n=1 Tax=Kiloniella sp. TaxID=1938587 RepID=UPI003B02543D